MNELVGKMLAKLRSIGKPDFELNPQVDTDEDDQFIDELSKKRRELERRLRLLDIQGSPRSFNG